MDFKKATDALLDRVTQEELAEKLGVSIPTIRQARLSEESMAYRTPPKAWHEAVRALAESRLRHFQNLIGQMDKEAKANERRTLAREGKTTHGHH
jgi:DNA-binding GntR family transcriptional regulator